MNQTPTLEFPRKFIYFEKQSNDRLCGLHCVNALCQGPFFDAFQLGEIGQKLDEIEKNLLQEEGAVQEPQTKPWNNVDDTGNYNVQVLSEALKLYGSEITPIKQSECEKLLRENMDSLEAFIFNSSTHWFSIRKINGIWFNLNSTSTGPGPQIISDFYMSAFLKGTEEIGYTNFLVKNLPQLPEIDSDMYKNLSPYQKLVSIDDILKYKPKKINMGDTDDEALERAIELSKKEFEKGGKNVDDYNKQYEHYEFLPDEAQMDFQQHIIAQNELDFALELSRKEFFAEMEKSLSEEPKEEEEHIELSIRTADGREHFKRRFHLKDTIGDIKKFMMVQLKINGEISLIAEHHNKIYIKDNETLQETGMKEKENLIVRIS